MSILLGVAIGTSPLSLLITILLNTQLIAIAPLSLVATGVGGEKKHRNSPDLDLTGHSFKEGKRTWTVCRK